MKTKQDGFITLDFIIAFGLVFGLTMILFSFAMTLTAIEIAQYLTFSVTRNAMAGNYSPADGQQEGQKKFKTLMQMPPYKILKSQWFKIEEDEQIVRDFTTELDADTKRGHAFFGCRLDFQAKILNLTVPFFGSTESTTGYKTHIGSYLYREPAATDTLKFYEFRWQNIQALDSAYSSVPQATPVLQLDNGG